MKVEDGINAVIQAAAAGVAILPGLKTLTGGVPTPPGWKELFGGAQLAVGAIVWLAVALFASELRQAPRRSILKAVAVSFVGFVVSLTIYTASYGVTVIRDQREVRTASGGREVRDEYAYYPIVLTGGLKDYVHRSGGRVSAVEENSVAQVNDKVRRHPVALHLTTTFLLVWYVLIPSSIVAALTILGWRVSGSRPA